jgi:hypothetical protein
LVTSLKSLAITGKKKVTLSKLHTILTNHHPTQETRHSTCSLNPYGKCWDYSVHFPGEKLGAQRVVMCPSFFLSIFKKLFN